MPPPKRTRRDEAARGPATRAPPPEGVQRGEDAVESEDEDKSDDDDAEDDIEVGESDYESPDEADDEAVSNKYQGWQKTLWENPGDGAC